MRYEVAGIRIRYQVLGIRYQVSGIRYQASSIRYQGSGIFYPERPLREVGFQNSKLPPDPNGDQPVWFVAYM